MLCADKGLSQLLYNATVASRKYIFQGITHQEIIHVQEIRLPEGLIHATMWLRNLVQQIETLKFAMAWCALRGLPAGDVMRTQFRAQAFLRDARLRSTYNCQNAVKVVREKYRRRYALWSLRMDNVLCARESLWRMYKLVSRLLVCWRLCSC